MIFKIREAREKAKLTQSQLAEQLGISFATLSGYETGRHDPRSDMLVEIAKIYHTSTDYLLGRENPTRSLSDDALAIAHKFDRLDPYSQQIVRTVVDMELARPASEYERAAAAFASAMEDATPDSPAASAK